MSATPRTDELDLKVQGQNWGYDDMKVLARKLEKEIGEQRTDKVLFATQLQELAEILTGQPGTVAHFRSLKEIALHLVATQHV